jgi:phosphoadenosine phosphosulfate reductase
LSEENQGEVRRIGFNKGSFEYSLESDVGNHLLKTVALNSAISRYRFDALFTGIRWDENPARGNEVFISQRDRPPHFRIQPILPFLERDVWNYMLANKLPIHPKYKEGYRSIDGVRDSKKVSDEPAWEQDMEHTSEREGRSQDKEGMMERLRQLGYM